MHTQLSFVFPCPLSSHVSSMPVHASRFNVVLFLPSQSLDIAGGCGNGAAREAADSPFLHATLVPGDIVDIAGGLAPNAHLRVCFALTVTSTKVSEAADWARLCHFHSAT